MKTTFKEFLKEPNKMYLYPHQDKYFIDMLKNKNIKEFDIIEYIKKYWPDYWNVDEVDLYEICQPMIKYERHMLLYNYLTGERREYFKDNDEVYELFKYAYDLKSKNCADVIRINVYNDDLIIDDAVKDTAGWDLFWDIVHSAYDDDDICWMTNLQYALGFGDSTTNPKYSIENAKKIVLLGTKIDNEILDLLISYKNKNLQKINNEFFDMLCDIGNEKGEQFIIDFFDYIKNKNQILEVASDKFISEYGYLFEFEHYTKVFKV